MNESVRKIADTADGIVAEYGTRDADELAQALGLFVMPRDFSSQKGVYTIILGSRFIFIKSDLGPEMRRIVLLHEIGHDTLHREAAENSGGFSENDLFDRNGSRMEYEANLFAAEVSLTDEEFLEHAAEGYSLEEIAEIMDTDVNLAALKTDILIARGYELNAQYHRSRFLRD